MHIYDRYIQNCSVDVIIWKEELESQFKKNHVMGIISVLLRILKESWTTIWYKIWLKVSPFFKL